MYGVRRGILREVPGSADDTGLDNGGVLMRSKLTFSLCLLMAFLLVSAGGLTLAQNGPQGERSQGQEQEELEGLKKRLLEAAHAGAGAEKKEMRKEDPARVPAESRPGGIVIGFEGGAQALQALVAGLAASLDEYIPDLDMAVLTLPAGAAVEDALAFLRGLPGVRWAEPDYLMRSFLVPNDTLEPQQWYLAPINAYQGWNFTTGSSDVTIAVVDSGIRPTHEDFTGGRVLPGYNTYTGGAVTSDNGGHGSLVAGAAGAVSNNAKGAAGIDWNAKILPVTVDNGDIPISKSVQGIKYAADNGADIINLSYGGGDYSQAEREAVDYAREKGCLLVAARGNDGDGGFFYPACLPNVLGVGSTGNTGQRSPFSNFGYGLDVMAPGEGIIGPGHTSDTAYLVGNGTSFSAPLVSGEAGLILAQHPGISPGEVEFRIERSAQGGGSWSEQMGMGIINIQGAIGISGGVYRDTLEPNDTRKQAVAAETGMYQSYLSHNSDIDIYRIQPELSGYGSFALLDIPSGCDYDMVLYQGDINDDAENGTWVAHSLSGGNVPEFIQYPLQAGETYYLAVSGGYGFSTQYAYSLLVLEPYVSDSWFFAEGYTGTGFDEWICVQNPGNVPATVEIDYMFDAGQDSRSYPVAPRSRYTINVNEEVGAGRNVSAALFSDTPVVAERPMYFDYKGKWRGGHDVVGATMPFNYWYFAEGYTGGGFEEWLCLQNPNNRAAEAVVTYMFQGGGTEVKRYSLKAESRYTVNVNEAVGFDRNVSIMVECDYPLVAERPMYFDYKGMCRGGHNVLGVNVPSATWFFAEGCTRPGFEQWLCLQNPYSRAADVEIYYLTSGGEVHSDNVRIPAYSRETVFVNESLGEDYDVSVAVFSDIPIVAERPMYFNYKGSWDGGHNSQGCTIPSHAWYFAEGCTRQGMDTWLCLQNPGETAASVKVDYMLGTGQTVSRQYSVAPLSRYTINAADDVGMGQDVAIRLESSQPIVAERPMYFDYKGSWRGGHDAMGYVPGY
jgi:subtilisin family serine protease